MPQTYRPGRTTPNHDFGYTKPAKQRPDPTNTGNRAPNPQKLPASHGPYLGSRSPSWRFLKMRVPDDWFVGFHQGLAARFWHAAAATMATDDGRLVRARLPRGSVLDVPCGDGRIARELLAA